MTDETSTPNDPDSDPGTGDGVGPRWDAVDVMRRRAELARVQRDRSLTELRESTTDEEALDEFGIDLLEIEK